MAVRKITEYPEEVLGKLGQPVTNFDTELAELCSDMFETMYDADGVGLAAPQIGLNLRLFVMDCDDIKLVAANPEIIYTEGEQSSPEGCLSVGKVPAVVVRPMKARLRAQNEKANGSRAMPKGTRHGHLCTKPTIATESFSSTTCRRCVGR